jgi:hypothetical protein
MATATDPHRHGVGEPGRSVAAAGRVIRDEELVDRLPAEPHDVRMTHALTPGPRRLTQVFGALLHRGSQGIAQTLGIGVSDVQVRRDG